jgi:hypothetical protein
LQAFLRHPLFVIQISVSFMQVRRTLLLIFPDILLPDILPALAGTPC